MTETTNTTDHEKLILNILQKLDNISSRLDNLESKLNQITQSGENMDRHINFVENIYESIKYPFHSLMNVTNLSLGWNNNEISSVDHPLLE